MKHDSKIIASIATVLFMLLLFLMLWFIYIDAPYLPEEEGIEVAFGDGDEGGGMPEPTPAASAIPETVAPPPTPAAPSTNNLMTQDDESIALEKQRKEEAKRKAAEEAERIRKQKEEEARLEAERIAKEKAIAEQRAKEQKAIDNAKNLMGGAFSGNSASAAGGNGSEGTSGVKGNPLGHGTDPNGNGWSLAGRSLKGKLADPLYGSNVEGVVVVNIRVNAQGQVISATKGQGTTISDQNIINAACAAAKKAEFSSYKAADGGSAEVVGTITYKFKLK